MATQVRKIFDKREGTLISTGDPWTTIITYPVPKDTIVHVWTRASAMRNSALEQSATWILSSSFKRVASGSVARVGSGDSTISHDSDTITADVRTIQSGTTILIQCSGLAGATIEFYAYCDFLVFTPEFFL